MNESDAHKHFSAACFNGVWDLLDRTERTGQEDELMVEMAHASLYHWLRREDATPENLSVGYWQIARVYATVGDAGMARVYADRCVKISDESSLAPFYRGYAYEAAARSAKLAGASKEAAEFLEQARALAGEVEAETERALLMGDLEGLA